MDKKVKYWIDISEYDLLTAKSMLETKRYLYVGFMCHQSIEKILKAHWQFSSETMPPKTHNISYLASKTGLFEQLSDEQKDFFDELEPLNIETRYPVNKDALMKKLDDTYSKEIYMKTKGLYRWIKKKL